ncbi:MAG: CotH kinase family protein [Clostridiales bacterium]|nr:CotH kinase family protein [Clostridiales bacterium]
MKKFLIFILSAVLALTVTGCSTTGKGPSTPTEKKDFDTKNYYLVGSFTAWETSYSESMKFTRLSKQDKDGFTVYTKEIMLLGGDQFKIVNDGDPSKFYDNEMNFNSLKAGGASTLFFCESNHLNIVLSDGFDGKYKITLHTDPDTPENSYFTIDATAIKPDVPSPDDDIYEFGDEISKENTAFYKDYTEEEKALYYSLWQETTSISIKVDIEPKELQKINEAFKSEDIVKQDTYRKCNLTVTVNGTDYYYDEVGIRMRGNTSRREFCDENGQIYAYVHYRFNLGETFDGEEYENGAWGSDILHDWSGDSAGRKARKNRSFATMEKFYYKWNKNYDQTYIREIYANRMFQAYGILAPHITLTQFSVKQDGEMESLGIGNLYETVDKQFIKRNFDKENKGGDLYKCTYTMGPADLSAAKYYGIGDEYTYALKTNDDPTDADYNNHKYLLDFIEALSEKDNEVFAEKLESLMDMNYFTRFEAVNYAVGNPDCIRNNFNNYYLYFTPAGKTYIIPYDYDRCFGINRDWNPTGNGMTQAGPYDTTSYGSNIKNTNPLYTKTILPGGIDKYRKLYKSKLYLVFNGAWMQYDNFYKIYYAYKTVYNDYTAPSPAIVNNCDGNVDWSRLGFSENGTTNFGSTTSNISMQDYLAQKHKTWQKFSQL